MRATFFTSCAAAVAATLVSLPPVQAQSKVNEEYSAIYTNISNVGAVGAVPITIRISRWTTDQEHEQLMKVLADRGNEAFVRELQRADRTGSIGTPQELPYHLRYARQGAYEKTGRRIILMTDRPMSFAERTSGGRTRDYSVTWIDLRLDAEGKGEGTISLATRLKLAGDILGVEDLGNIPAKLTNIKKVR